MAKFEVEFRTSSGGDPVRLAVRLGEALQPAAEIIQFALENQRSRILERTAQGLDCDNKPFAPCSTQGPDYYYPSTQRDRSFFPAVKSLTAICAGRSTFRAEAFAVLGAAAKRSSMRPRSSDRGNVDGAATQRPVYHCFNEAAILGSRKWLPPYHFCFQISRTLFARATPPGGPLECPHRPHFN